MSTALDQEIAPSIRLRFDTAEALLKFLGDEQERWAHVATAATRHPSMRDRIVQAQKRRLNKMMNQVTNSMPAKDAWAAHVDSMMWFSERNEGGRALCSLIPADAAVLNLIEADPDAAVIGMSARQHDEETLTQVSAPNRADAVLALCRFAAAGARPTAHTESFTRLHNNINELLNDWKKDVSVAIKAAEATLEGAAARSDALDAQKAAQAQAHDDMVQEHKKALKAMEEQFLAQMVLRAPVQYWKDRATAGHRAATTWLWAFIIAAVGIFGIVIWQGPGLLSLLKDKNDQISLAAVPLLLAALVPLLWVLRHMARLFADNVADARDASQRSALTSTFLALATQEKVDFSEAERAIIIQALFRPSPAQSADDGVPVPLLELLKR
jgi:hypothetical protein